MIQLGKQLGYAVCTNTTIYRETDMDEIEAMMVLLTELAVDGMMISPGYHYEALKRITSFTGKRSTRNLPES